MMHPSGAFLLCRCISKKPRCLPEQTDRQRGFLIFFDACKVNLTLRHDHAIIGARCKVNMTRGGEGILKNRIKELREQYNLTQKQLGEKVGVSRQAINAIETNKFDPSIWLAYDIATFFNLTIEEVFLFQESKRQK